MVNVPPGYSKGGECYWASGLHLFAPLPLITNSFLQRIKLHSFLTAGNLIESGMMSNLFCFPDTIKLENIPEMEFSPHLSSVVVASHAWSKWILRHLISTFLPNIVIMTCFLSLCRSHRGSPSTPVSIPFHQGVVWYGTLHQTRAGSN